MCRKTLINTTGSSPGERIYETKIDLVKRSEVKINDSNDKKVVNKEFRREDQVQLRMYNSDKWKLG